MSLSARASQKVQKEVENLPFEEFLTYRLSVLSNQFSRHATDILWRKAEIHLSEWRVMALLGTRGKLSITEIATIMHMDRGLISRTLSQLTDKGLVLSERQRQDRRLISATLTTRGRELFEIVLPVMQKRQIYLLSCLTEAERQAAYSIIAKLEKAVGESPDLLKW